MYLCIIAFVYLCICVFLHWKEESGWLKAAVGGVESYLKLVTVCNAVTQTRYLNNNEENEKKRNLKIDRRRYQGHVQEKDKIQKILSDNYQRCLEITSITLTVIRNGDEVDDSSWKSETEKIDIGRTKHKTENRYDTNTGINPHEIQINEHSQSEGNMK